MLSIKQSEDGRVQEMVAGWIDAPKLLSSLSDVESRDDRMKAIVSLDDEEDGDADNDDGGKR